MAKRPKIILKPVASHYQAPDEKIIEISSEAGGCLVSARLIPDGQLKVDVYRADPTVTVVASGTMLPEVQESLRRVLAYAIPDEADDYAEQVEAGEDVSRHIMTDLDILAAWLDRQRGK